MGFVYLNDGTRVHTSQLFEEHQIPEPFKMYPTATPFFDGELRKELIKHKDYLLRCKFYGDCPMDFGVI